MNISPHSLKNPLRWILNSTIAIFTVLLIIYIGIRAASVLNISSDQKSLLESIAEDLRLIALSVFRFVQPFLSLVIILIILEWLLNRFGLSLNQGALKLEWNVQTVIALVIIIAFALAALSGVEGGGMLKDVALVVVGFYFGTQKKSTEIIQGDSKIAKSGEHSKEREELLV